MKGSSVISNTVTLTELCLTIFSITVTTELVALCALLRDPEISVMDSSRVAAPTVDPGLREYAFNSSIGVHDSQSTH